MLSCRTLGQHVSYLGLMPGFLVFGIGGGLMQVPLTEAVIGATPPERGGVASALLNDSREVAGLLGITVIGVVLRSVQSGSLRDGHSAATAFLDGYHAGLAVTIAVLAVCLVITYRTLRPGHPAETETSASLPASATARPAASSR